MTSLLSILLIILLANAISWIVIYFYARRNASNLPNLKPRQKLPQNIPLVSIIIPARNEEKMISKALESLTKLTYPKFEVIIINDGSTDRTGQIISEYTRRCQNFRVLENPTLPEGWLGKQNGMHKGAKMAKGDLLLFRDADIIFEPDILQTAVDYLQCNKLAMFSMFAKLRCVGFWENVVMPLVYSQAAIQLKLRKIQDINKPKDYAAFGAFMLVSREAFEAVGGFTQIKSEMLDDIEFAGLLKKARLPIMLALGRDLLSVRMYTNFSEVYAGYLKNLSTVLKNSILLVIANVTGFTFLYLGWVALLIAGLITNSLWLTISSIGVFLFIVIVIRSVRVMLEFKWWAPWIYLPGILLLFILTLHSSFLAIGKKQAHWRGRTINLEK